MAGKEEGETRRSTAEAGESSAGGVRPAQHPNPTQPGSLPAGSGGLGRIHHADARAGAAWPKQCPQ